MRYDDPISIDVIEENAFALAWKLMARTGLTLEGFAGLQLSVFHSDS